MENIKKIQKAEIKFVDTVEKLYLKEKYWNIETYIKIYEAFKHFCRDINRDEISLLSVADIQLRDGNNMYNKIVNSSEIELKEYIISILTNDNIHISMKIILIGGISKIVIGKEE